VPEADIRVPPDRHRPFGHFGSFRERTDLTVRLENSFEVGAPVEDAWMLLNDVPRVVPCMPGAELVETIDENSWKGVVRVRLGPVALHFDTTVSRIDQDSGARRIVLLTKARESRGRGSAQATIESSLSDTGEATLVRIITDVTLQGAVAQYGRGILPEVASELTQAFAENLASLLTEETESRPADAAPERPAAVPVSVLRLVARAAWSRIAGYARRIFTRKET
jgi:carbon monoxide dehydrogenase subunit G